MTDRIFGAPADEALFATSVGQTQLVSADPYLNKMLIAYCEDALASRRSAETFRSRVENAIVPLLPHGKARASDVARQLGTSDRTFARRLSSEGLTFSELLERLRHDLARRYLVDGDLSISQIAWLLGFSGASAFSHACRRWTGDSPSGFRGGAV